MGHILTSGDLPEGQRDVLVGISERPWVDDLKYPINASFPHNRTKCASLQMWQSQIKNGCCDLEIKGQGQIGGMS